MIPTSEPLVSCLCVTRNRGRELERAVLSFSRQTYRNKELVIVYEQDDPATATVVEGLRHRLDIRAIEVPIRPKLKLGELRNLAIHACQGEYFCQWDDDDWFHVERIETQMRQLLSTRQDACMLTNWLVFDAIQQQAYFSHFRLWEGSLLCRKAALQGSVRYPALPKMEDSFFVNELIRRGRVVPLVAPQLYVYVLHGNNTWDKYHGRVLLSSSQPLSQATSQLISAVLSGSYSPEEASLRLGAAELLAELNYFHVNTLTPTDEQLHRYLQTMERLTGAGAAAIQTTV
jgi:glycosyltransferase involved in cell wall biosynthesis